MLTITQLVWFRCLLYLFLKYVNNIQMVSGQIGTSAFRHLSKFSRQESWKKGRPWLMYDNKKNVMKCSFSTSRNDNISSAFITGCNRFRIENIKNKIPWKVRFPYIRSIDINEAKTIKFRKTPAECVIQNLKLLLLQCIYIFFHLFIYVFFFSGF
jgi:hypothetical protein